MEVRGAEKVEEVEVVEEAQVEAHEGNREELAERAAEVAEEGRGRRQRLLVDGWDSGVLVAACA